MGYPYKCTGKDTSLSEYRWEQKPGDKYIRKVYASRPCQQCHGELVIRPRLDKQKLVRASTTRLPEAICDFIVGLLPCEECGGTGASGDWRLHPCEYSGNSRSWCNFSQTCHGKPVFGGGQCWRCWWYDRRRL